MNIVDLRSRFIGVVAIVVVLGAYRFAPEPAVRSAVPADEFIRAMSDHRSSLINFYLDQHLNPNARGEHDRPLIVAAALQQNWKMVRSLVEAGASLDLADDAGLTPLMVAAQQGNVEMMREFVGHITNIAATDRSGRSALHYAIAAQNLDAVDLLLLLMPDLGVPSRNGRDLLAAALDTGNRKVVATILNRLPALQAWTPNAQRALAMALGDGDRDLVRLLLKKHAAPPTPPGRNVPLLAYAIVQSDPVLFKTLLECGADPNTTMSGKYDKDFLDALPKHFRNYIEDDKNVTVLMLAAGIGRPEHVQTLLQAGADRNRATGRYKMLALYLAAETGNWRCTQILLGSGPSPEQLRIEISLASQHVALIKDGVPILNSSCSTGREGYSTKRGYFVITDKERYHRSTIYHVDMPYFMRLSCLDFGMHEGVVPNYPASHGCIRLPGDTARKLFAEIPIGTLVTVQ